MQAIGTPALLDLWDRGHALSRESWALALLGAAQPDDGPDALALWPVGRRDLALLRLRGRLFGRVLDGLAPCPRCHEQAEFSASVDELGAAPDDARFAFTTPPDGHGLEAHGCSVRFRAVNTSDL